MYTAIYRDFRPDSFDQIVGQDHIVRILKSQIASGRTGHAYLFCGTRGTGKTTTARILAKALNCESEDIAARPCCECASCRAIKEGSFMDVIEIDAASNNGVDNIRELRESVKYPPAVGRNKVYIIDEVHMLSTGAFNALLKTLEEPPENVVFILATTEPQKLPATILSRCMRLDFRRVSEKTIADNMRMICEARGLEADEAALALIAVNADGSVRDSLSILEQCISTGDKRITRDDVAEMLGTAGEDVMIELTDLVMKADMSSALLLLDSAINSGRDVKQFMKEWLAHFRNLLMAKYIQDPESALNMSLENVERVRKQSTEISTDLLNRGITELTKTISESRWSAQPRVMLEMCIVRLGVGQEELKQTVFRYDGAAPAVSDSGVSSGGAQAVRAAQQTVQQPVQDNGLSDEERYLQSLIDSESGNGISMMPPEPDHGDMYGTSAAPPPAGRGNTPTEAHSAQPQTAPPAGRAVPGLTPEAADLWNTVVKKAVGEKPMLIRIENRAKLVGMDDKNFYVAVQDDMTARIIKERGREILEKKMEEYHGTHLTLRLAKQKGVPLAKEQDKAEMVAEQIKEKFHIDVEIK
ncbi:MAG: DNA polymerase III subunit gamma/tau [Anaerovoracaceae bacterium]|nr:DNA polymerase III subunit gamma/tau [Anaerovoracaceae bacterium]